MKRGRKAKILLDSIDMDVLRRLKRKPQGVMELKKEMRLRHSSLKSHITRLSRRGLIDKTPVKKSNKVILSIPKKKKVSNILTTFR